MFDFLCILFVVGFFAVAGMFVHGLERLAADEEETP